MTFAIPIPAGLRRWAVGIIVCLILVGGVPAADEPIAFFESKVRPILVEQCYSCHSRERGKAKGGLELDSRETILQGGERGAAIVPKKPEDSLLIKAVRHSDSELRMPPEKKLSEQQIAALEAWVKMGAPFPKPAAKGFMGDVTKSHWAFQTIKDPSIPVVRDADWPRGTIDSFVLAQLESQRLTPSPRAHKRTLIRRAYFDLIGLPPTCNEVDAFERDDSVDAFARLVDRLLASPRYGERWGRHWLDVARYSDTKDGVLMFGDDRVWPFAYTYRDYVIRSFNDDLPFDRFIHEQIAADLIEPAVEPSRLAALGFLTLGRLFDGNIHDVIDDRIDTVSRGMLGLTVSCARCHDHKFDPIPTADYYSLYGVFAGCEAPIVMPQLDPAQRGPAEFEKKYTAKKQEIERMLANQYVHLSNLLRQRATDYLVRVATTPHDPMETAVVFFSLDPDSLRLPIVARWRQFLTQRVTANDPVFGPWHELFALPDADFATAAQVIVDRFANGTLPVNQLVINELTAAPLSGKVEVARAYGKLLARVWNESRAAAGMMSDDWNQLLDILTGKESPAFFPLSHTRQYMARADTDAFGKMLLDLDKLAVQEPAAPPRAMAVFDLPDRDEPRVLIRGNPGRKGEQVPRQFLAAVAGNARRPFANGSGRLDLAKAITAADNPLTARVIVNRIWMHHFGEPLVETPNDFGLRCSPPVQAGLLDHLATTFRRDGWSIKSLHRRIMLSATYQQASADRADCRRVDPENRLLWKMNRRRLDFEPLRDAMLAVSGRLEDKSYGRPVDVANDPLNGRRTVYGLVDRQSLPGLFRSFDFASPDQSAERRTRTTVPQQALFGLNGPFVMQQANRLAARSEVKGKDDSSARVRALYRIVLQREPAAEELGLGIEFVGNDPQPARWEQFAHVLLLTNEFVFVD